MLNNPNSGNVWVGDLMLSKMMLPTHLEFQCSLKVAKPGMGGGQAGQHMKLSTSLGIWVNIQANAAMPGTGSEI